MKNGVIAEKLRNLEIVLSELRSLGHLEVSRLQEEWLVRRAVERNLQIAVEIMIDVCHRLISLAGRAPATTGREAVEDCVAMGVLPSADPYRQMVGFRNIVVHDYQEVKPEVLCDIVNRRLDDFGRFRDEILRYVSD